ncbi:MAG: DegQ family serine endoprotease [Pseudomonadota bacterium]
MVRKFLLMLVLWAPVFAAAQLPDFTELVEKQGTAVVNISSTQVVRTPRFAPQMPHLPEDDPFYEFFRRFAPPNMAPREFEAQSLGSGFIISGDGYVLTNYHVIDGAEEVTVTLTDKREFKAAIVGKDKRSDVALLKIDATGLPTVKIGDPSKLKVGEWVLAIGSPFGFENTVTAGIVSAKGRSLPQENFVPFIQTDVAINPGNSGGPLFNLKGEVVGVNSQIYSRTGGFMGLSFAIPIDVAIDVTSQLKSSGRVSRGRIGVMIQEVTKDLAESFGLSKPTGALVSAVEKGSPADKAGVEASDVILKFDGKTINSSNDLPRIVGTTKPGSKAKVELWRRGGTKEVTITVGEMPEEGLGKRGDRGEEKANRLGLALSELPDDMAEKLKIKGGVVVENVQGIAARAGIRRGDVIAAINNQEIESLDQFNDILDKVEKGRSVALLVRRGENSIYIALKLKE